MAANIELDNARMRRARRIVQLGNREWLSQLHGTFDIDLAFEDLPFFPAYLHEAEDASAWKTQVAQVSLSSVMNVRRPTE